MTMVARVVKALQKSDDDCGAERHGKYWEDMARAAIEAMREPSEEMREQGCGAGWHGGIEGLHDAEKEAATNLWQAMISEALKEKE